MKKSLISIIALMLTVAFGAVQAQNNPAPAAAPAAPAAAAPAKKEEKKEDPIAVACKGKKVGEEVTVDGKKVKCPAPKKKDMKKKTTEPAPAPAAAAPAAPAPAAPAKK